MPVKLPAFQFYPGDWMKDLGVRALSFHDRGVWLEMLCLMHESEQRGKLLLNGTPIDEETLARILGLDKQILTLTITKLLTTRVASLDEETGAIMCRRMVRDESIRKVRAESGLKGGNPALLKQNATTWDNQTPKQNPTPSSSSSSSTLNTTPIGRATHAHALHIQQELSIPASMGQIAPLLQLIDFEAKNRGGPEAATDWLIAQGKEAKARGETVNVWWFTDKRYEGNKGGLGGNSQARTAGNRAALAAALEPVESGTHGPC